MNPRHFLKVCAGVLALSGMYLVSALPATSSSLPDAEILRAEGGGTYIPGSMVTLLEEHDARTSWALKRYRTTEYECIDMYFTALPNARELGSFGGCGYDLTATMPVILGFVADVSSDVNHRGAFGFRVPIGTAKVRVTLSTGSIMEAIPVDGVWMITWTDDAEVTVIEALSSAGLTLKRCEDLCAD